MTRRQRNMLGGCAWVPQPPGGGIVESRSIAAARVLEEDS
jgi:hypothetical protein